MKTGLVLLQPSAGFAIFRLYCGHPKHQQMLGASLPQALDGNNGHNR